jgi:hypothetical protein
MQLVQQQHGDHVQAGHEVSQADPAGASVMLSCRPASAPDGPFWRRILISDNTRPTGRLFIVGCRLAPMAASRSGTGLAVPRGLLGGRDAAQRERHQRRGQGQQYRGQGERRGGGAKQLPAGAAQRLGGA